MAKVKPLLQYCIGSIAEELVHAVHAARLMMISRKSADMRKKVTKAQQLQVAIKKKTRHQAQLYSAVCVFLACLLGKKSMPKSFNRSFQWVTVGSLGMDFSSSTQQVCARSRNCENRYILSFLHFINGGKI